MTLRRNKSSGRRSAALGVIDIGTSKVAAAIITSDGGEARVAGVGLQRSKGMKAGVLTDLDAAEGAVRAAIGQAERAAGITLDGVVASFAAGRLKSRHFVAKADVASGRVTQEDLDRATKAGRDFAERDGRSLVHLNTLGLRLDGVASVKEVRGLVARQLTADFHAVTADEAPLRNLLLLIERCYLACDGVIATPYASALSVTTREEREMGITVIDIGAGTAGIAVFAEGHLVGVDVIPVGSQHITFDIARALQTPLTEAERIKTLYGALISAQSDEHELFSYPLAGEEEGATGEASRARLTGLIQPRFAQICSLVRERLAENPAVPYAGEMVVLTGGAVQLLGTVEFASRELGRPVRIGRPAAIAGLPASVAGPHFSALCGLIAASAEEGGILRPDVEQSSQGYLGRVGSWLKSSF